MRNSFVASAIVLTSDAIKGMVAKPEYREEVVAKLFKSVGGKLIGWYLTFGHHDWLAIGEFPNEKATASAVLRKLPFPYQWSSYAAFPLVGPPLPKNNSFTNIRLPSPRNERPRSGATEQRGEIPSPH
jgi:hypothetical protein